MAAYLQGSWLVASIGSATQPIKSAIASAKFMGFYISNSATSGTSTGFYMRHIVTGTAGGACAVRAYADTTGVAASNVTGIQASVGTGESTSAGSVSGLGAGVYAQVGIANATLAGGTFAAVNAEVYTWGSSSVITSCDVSLIRLSNQGAGNTGIDTNVNRIEVAGFTSGASSAYYDKGSAITGVIYGWLRIKTPAGLRYIPTYVSLS